MILFTDTSANNASDNDNRQLQTSQPILGSPIIKQNNYTSLMSVIAIFRDLSRHKDMLKGYKTLRRNNFIKKIEGQSMNKRLPGTNKSSRNSVRLICLRFIIFWENVNITIYLFLKLYMKNSVIYANHFKNNTSTIKDQ